MGISFITPIVDKALYPKLYQWVQILLCLIVIFIFTLDIFVRIYLKPRAEDMRLKDFLSHAYSIPLLHDQTVSYYNNNETEPFRKIAAQLLENSLHSKTTALKWQSSSVYILYFIH